ncbi:MAG: carboxylating nicotinate-nucleotide diphosphorylase [Acidobacteria bacterium]|nr:carboxylating nicotinate-nucleotide diphosphorylase [Acidobacteriota bacterium]
MFELDKGLEIVELALKEDLPAGDLTADAIFSDNTEIAAARVETRESCVIAGFPAVRQVVAYFSDIELSVFHKDGDRVSPGDIIYTLTGHPASILKAERTLLNFLQHLSGIATKTSTVVNMLSGSGIQLLDTRKTTPGMRHLEKYAVRAGGGHNHRFSLSDGILIKENHIRAAGSIKAAIGYCQKQASHLTKIEIEVENLSQLDEALSAGADGVLLDNMSTEEIAAACTRKENHSFFIEVSGGITEARIAELLPLDIDYISMGALTHSAKIIDMTLLF